MNDLDGITKEFLVESYENLDQLDRDLIALEKNPTDRDILSSIFRTIHTIKGTCGFLGFSKLEAVTHCGENLLGLLRDGKIGLNSRITSALLSLVDAVQQMLTAIEQTGKEGEGEYSALIAELNALVKGGNSVAAVPSPEVSGLVRPPPGNEDSEEPLFGEILVKKGHAKPEEVAQAVLQQQEGDRRHIGEILVERSAVPSAEIARTLKTQADSRATGVAESNIRVEVVTLDKLMNLVGELVLARNQILQFTSTQKDAAFTSTSQRLNLITTELQEGIMKTRMQPIGNIWGRFPRVVRNLALACGKEVRIEMEGEDTELDKTIIEAIKDPLTHLVRNAVDHGIETPEARLAAGKPSEGRLFLRAFHEGGQVNIEISDDGGGIPGAKVRQKAVERGLISSEQADRLSEREQLNLIFLPGCSTAAKVTNVSGRGVGMDVVKTNVEKIGGTIDLHSTAGQGTTVKMKIPLTLAIIPALIVTCCGDRYAIPQVSLLELVRLAGEEAKKGVERIHSAPVYRLRGKLLPLVYLSRELGVRGADSERAQKENINIVVLQAEDRQFGLVVEGIQDTEEIVVKPLGKQFKGITAYSGSAIMGDGKVALILDVLGLAQSAHVVSETRDRMLAEKEADAQQGAQARQMLLVSEAGPQRRVAIPLALVARLEEFPQSAVERTEKREVVQYRGEIMPLLYLSHLLDRSTNGTPGGGDSVQVVVYSEQARSVGMVVDRILDIVEETLEVKREHQQEGVLGAAVIQGRVTDLLDVPGILRMADLRFSAPSGTVEGRA